MAKTVSLAALPAGDDLEDYVAALFQAAGYFVEKNLVERDPSDILELDIVATNYGEEQSRSILVEVKGGTWGYPDLFKVVGWMRYLNQPRGAIFVKTSEKDLEKVRTRISPLGVTLVEFSDFSKSVEVFTEAGFGQSMTASLVRLWRHSYQVERRLAKLILSRSKSDKEKQGPKEALRYQRLINDGTFFARSPEESLGMLYDAYKEHPKLTLANSLELDGAQYDPFTASVPSKLLQQAMTDGEHPYLQACMFVEHRARLAILKAAVDYATANPTGPLITKEGTHTWIVPNIYSLPKSFKDAMHWLRNQPNFRRYAIFWQQFMWGWGGFYLEDRREKEFAWMAEYSGIPVEEIPTALQAFDKFFPVQGGWFVTPGYTCATRAKMTPAFFHGIGAHHRRQEYELKEGFRALSSSGYTENDLNKWNNCTVAYLRSRNGITKAR